MTEMKRRSQNTGKAPRNAQGLRNRLVRWILDSKDPKEKSRSSYQLRPRLEQLEGRRLLAATDLAAITGLVFNDSTGNGFDAGEEVANVALDLYRDDGDGSFEPGGDDDPVLRTAMTGVDGRYSFDRLTAGSYFVLQRAQTASGVTLARQESSLITINPTDVQGRAIRTIDSFDQTTQTVSDSTNNGVGETLAMAAPEAIGGERDFFVSKTSNDGEVQLSANNPLQPNRLSFNEQLGGDGIQRVSWDGPDGDAGTIADNGLPVADRDLTSGGDALGFSLLIRSDSGQGNAIVRLYSDDGTAGTANRFSTVTIPIQNAASGTQIQEFIPFASLSPTSGGGATTSNVGAIELEISGEPDVDGTVSLIGTIGQTLLTQDFANFQSADLSLTKTANTQTPALNQNVTFTITVSNSGPSPATSVQVTDVLPAGINFVNATASQGGYNSGSGIWDVGSINNGSSATLSLIGTVTTSGAKTNTARVSRSDQSDPDSSPDNNVESEDDQASVTITPESIDLSLTKTVDNGAPNVGENVTFTITASNAGPSIATGVNVRDTLPAGLTFVSSAPSQGSYNNGTGIWNVGTINPSTSASLSITATVVAEGSRTNVAEIQSADQFDINSTPNNNNPGENDQASAVFSTPVADLSLTKTVNAPSANVGESVIFTVSLANAGPNPATGVAVTDILPAGLTLLGSSPSQGSYTPGTGVWDVGTVSLGTTPTLSITARVDSSGAKVNTAQVSAVDQSDPDSSPNNNVSGEDDQDSATVTPPSINLSLDKQIDNARPNVGDNVTYTVTLNNAGPGVATGVSVRDTIPPGLSFLNASPSIGSYDNGTGIWNVGSVGNGSSATLSIVARVEAATSITNTAEVVSADQFDPNSTPANNIPAEDDQDSVSLSPASSDLSLSKTVDIASPDVGQNVNFTITVTNGGPDVATGVSVRDVLPAGNSFVSASPSIGNYEPSTGVWTIGSIGVGSSATLNLIVTAQTSGLAINTAEVISADQNDPDSTPNNNIPSEDDQDSAEIQPQQIDLFLNKSVSNSSPNVGETVSFVITVGNNGPSTATGVAVTESLPSGVTLQSSTPSQGSFNTSTGVWTVGSIGNGGQATLTLSTRVDNVGVGTNSAEVTAADQADVDSTPNNNIAGEDDQASATFTAQVADLSLTKTASNTAPNIGDQVSFEVMVANAGPDTATNIRIADAIPSGMTFVSNTLTSGTYDSATGVWTIDSLAVDSTATLTILTTVDSQGTKTNTARVVAVDQADTDSTPGNDVLAEDDQDAVDVTPPVIDLSLSKSASPDRPSVGQDLTYTLTVSNAGPQTATGVEIVDVLPAGLSFTGSTPSTGSYDAATGTWTVGSIASGDNATLQVVATVNSADVKNNTAQVTAANEFDIDSTPNNDNAAEDDQASVAATPASADLSLAKTVNDATPNLGDEVTFTLTANNDGPDDAADIVVQDSIPTGMTLVSSIPSAGTFDANTGQWSIPALINGGSATLQIVARVDTIGDKTNTAEITASSQFDPDSTPSNNNAIEDDQASAVLSPELVDLALSKSVSDLSPNVGDTIQYILSLSNDGPSTATGVEVTDPLTSGVTFTQATPSRGSYNPNTGVWAVGDVPVGETPTLTLVAVVNDTRTETNTAEITATDQPDVDSTPGNNAAGEDDIANVTFNTQVADLSLTKTVDTVNPNQSDNVTFTLTLSNDGPDTATDVMISDPIPSGLRFVSASPSIGTYDASTGIWTVPSVAVGSITSLQLVTAVTAANTSTNVTEILSARQFDPDSTPGNDVVGEDDRAEVAVTPQVVDIAVEATVDNPTPLEGETIQVVFRATNAGPSDASGVQLNTLLPDGLTLITSQPQTGSYDSVSGAWDVGNLAAGASTQLTLNARVDTRGFKQIPIQVTATDQFDIDSTPANDVDAEDDQAELIVRAPRLLHKRLFMSR